MTQYFPFQVQFANGAAHDSPEQMYRITADFEAAELADYRRLFDKYGAAEGLLSLVDVTALLIESSAPDLLDHMDFDEEGYQLDMHVDSEQAVAEFAAIVCAAFRDIAGLEKYIQRVADR